MIDLLLGLLAVEKLLRKSHQGGQFLPWKQLMAFIKITLLDLGNIREIPQFTQIDSRQWATIVVDTLLENDGFQY